MKKKFICSIVIVVVSISINVKIIVNIDKLNLCNITIIHGNVYNNISIFTEKNQ